MLGLAPLPRTLAAALRDVEHKKVEIRLSALKDLGRLAAEGKSEAVRALSAALANDTAPAVRSEAAVALADARATSAVPELLAALTEDPVVRVRQLALVALGELGSGDDAELRARVEACLRDAEPELRFQALIAVAHLFGSAAEHALVRGARDEDAYVRYVALRLFEERWLASGASELPATMATVAERALRDDSADVRLAAAILLARAGRRQGEDILVRAVVSGEGTREPEDAEAAIDLVGELGLESARAGLEKRAFGFFGRSSDPFAWQAKVALARLGHTRATASILGGLASWSRDTRTLAVTAAGRARLRQAMPLISAMRGRPERAEPEAVDEALSLLEQT